MALTGKRLLIGNLYCENSSPQDRFQFDQIDWDLKLFYDWNIVCWRSWWRDLTLNVWNGLKSNKFQRNINFKMSRKSCYSLLHKLTMTKWSRSGVLILLIYVLGAHLLSSPRLPAVPTSHDRGAHTWRQILSRFGVAIKREKKRTKWIPKHLFVLTWPTRQIYIISHGELCIPWVIDLFLYIMSNTKSNIYLVLSILLETTTVHTHTCTHIGMSK